MEPDSRPGLGERRESAGAMHDEFGANDEEPRL
jgi:hypothetical protein